MIDKEAILDYLQMHIDKIRALDYTSAALTAESLRLQDLYIRIFRGQFDIKEDSKDAG
jgi:hypothetical protein